MSEKIFSIGNREIKKGTLTKYGTIDYFITNDENETLCVIRQYLTTQVIPFKELKKEDIIDNYNRH